MRFLVALLFAAQLAFAGGAAPLSGSAGCVERCPDDDSDGRCPADCTDCGCCPHLQVVVVGAGAQAPVVASPIRVPAQLALEPSAPEGDDIRHVPKSVFA